jgi:NadR type nicotinamide-nucleotide adenylyltransferase
VIVKHITDDTLPQQPSDVENEAVFRKVWVDQAKKAADGMSIDFYYASEDYGHWMAEGLSAEFVPVDPGRWANDVSGTDVRNGHIYGRWSDLPNVVKEHYVKRVVLFGPESAGKTTLAKHLAADFDTAWVPEYGRIYTDVFASEIKARGFEIKDFEKIRAGHLASVKAQKKNANRILIEDTDPLMTAVWCETMIGSSWFGYGRDPSDYGDYYLLCPPDIGWEQDGTRYFPNEEHRWNMYHMCERYLKTYGKRYDTVVGKGPTRLNYASGLVSSYLEELTL